MSEDCLWTYADVAARWQVSVRQARRRLDSSPIRPVMIGPRTRRFRPADVIRWEAEASGVRSRSRFAVT